MMPNISFGNDAYEVLDDTDSLAICTEWNIFRTPEFDVMKSAMKSNVIFDGRNLYDLHQMEEQGFYYNSIGRKIIN
jgi:UDPglucose 6-dehydrogenase